MLSIAYSKKESITCCPVSGMPINEKFHNKAFYYLNNLLLIVISTLSRSKLSFNISGCSCIKRGFLFLIIIFSTWSIASCQPGKNQHLKVGAYYFGGWSGKSGFDDDNPEHIWAKGMPTHYTQKLATEFSGRCPIWGWREDNEQIMEKQIDIAADNGVSFFAFCWYWFNNKGPINTTAIENSSLNCALNLFMNAANNDKMEFCLLVANHSGYEILGDDYWKQAADYWVKLFKHPQYLRLNGKPVIVIYKPSSISKVGLNYLKDISLKEGFPGVEIAGCGECSPNDGFTLQTFYNKKPVGTWNHENPSDEPHQYQELVEANLQLLNTNYNLPLIPIATQGWDRRPWEGIGGLGGNGAPISWNFSIEKSPEKFFTQINGIANWMEKNPEKVTKDKLMLIYAWNEIGEGGWLVPCKDDQNGSYLEVIKKVVFGENVK